MVKAISSSLLIIILQLFFLNTGKAQNVSEYKKNISVHDPVMIKQDSTYYIFCTGNGITVWSSKNLISWKKEKPVFATPPKWAVDTIPRFRGHIWAPDISYYKGKYYLYYSVSAFGKNTSAIGVATNTTLRSDDPDYKWIDHGRVIQSYPGKTNWNAIDPNLITDKDGTPYLFFGSFWGGLKVVKMSADRVSVAHSLDDLPPVASRVKNAKPAENPPAVDGNPADAGGNAIEAPFVFKKGKYYYLFASVDYCCKGPKSSYKMIVGRSENILGPYLDKNKVSLGQGGGTIIRQGDENWHGVGHNAVSTIDDTDYLVYHGYDAADSGKPKLIINKISWNKGWPEINYN